MALIHCLTDAKTWVDFWDESTKRWEPLAPRATEKLLERIRRKRISIHWRSKRVTEFTLTEDKIRRIKDDNGNL